MRVRVNAVDQRRRSINETLDTCHHCVLRWEVCVCVSQLAVTGTVGCNKSQRKLASSTCTLIHSFLLSLCALFSLSPNAETLNLHTQTHQGPKVCMNALWDVRSKTHAGGHTHFQPLMDGMHASWGDTY